jgi:GNAT superfamily N-acetyltransferase
LPRGAAGLDTSLEFRRALTSEASLLWKLALASKAHWPYSPSQLQRWMADLHVVAADIAIWPTVVALQGATLAGFYQLRMQPDRTCKLEHFWVAPEYIGKGVGRHMLANAVERASDIGAAVLVIESDPHAEGFYIARGARRTGDVPAPIEGAEGRVLPILEIALAERS